MPVQIQFRRDTAAAWTAANTVLAAGEMGLETDTTYYKIGDGSTAWTSLAYGSIQGSITAGSVDTAGLADGAVTTAKIADDAVTAAKLADTAVTAGIYTTADITIDAQGRITAASSGTIAVSELAADSVTTVKILDANVTAAKLAATAVTAGAYTTADITVDAQGRLTAASSGVSAASADDDQPILASQIFS